MKISKVNHAHAGVYSDKVNTRVETGYLYNPTNLETPLFDLDERLMERRTAAQKLYNPFNPLERNFKKYVEEAWGGEVSDDFLKKLRDIGQGICREFGIKLREPFAKYLEAKELSSEDYYSVYGDWIKQNITRKRIAHIDEIKDYEVENLVNIVCSHYLRKSLSGSFTITEGDVKVLKGEAGASTTKEPLSNGERIDFQPYVKLVGKNDGQSRSVDLSEVTRVLLLSMLQMISIEKDTGFDDVDFFILIWVLHRDYSKIRQMENLKKSIENQNVPVQCRPAVPVQCNDDSGVKTTEPVIRLMPSNAIFEGQKKEEVSKKAYAFSFMKKYAGADNKLTQDNMLTGINGLLILFIYGSLGYSESEGCSLSDLKSFPDGPDRASKLFCEEAGNGLRVYRRKLDAKERISASKKKEFWDAIKMWLRNSLCVHYQDSCKTLANSYNEVKRTQDPFVDWKKKNTWPEQMKEDMYWITWFEDCVERILRLQRGSMRLDSYKLKAGYLYRKCWSEFLSFIGQKYIALGKTVYHIVLPHEYLKDQEYDLGQVPDYYKTRGLTGFDYEQIKAVETLQRETSAYVASAAGNFIRSISDQQEQSRDLLMETQRSFISQMDAADLEIAYIRVMRYFGGISAWQGWLQTITAQAANGSLDSPEQLLRAFGETDLKRNLLDQIRASLYALRNNSFHYSAGMVNGMRAHQETVRAIVQSMLNREIEGISRVIREKYFNNNVWKFYKDEDIIKLLTFLYRTNSAVPAQIPSFHNVCKKEDLLALFEEWGYEDDSYDQNGKKIWENAFYFLMKECYYRGFLQDKNAMHLIKGVIRNWKTTKDMKKNEVFALNTFKQIIRSDGFAFDCQTAASFCQAVMGEYNRQNNELQIVITGNQTGGETDKRLYEHYPILLRRGLREALKEYIIKHEDKFAFIGSPCDREADLAGKGKPTPNMVDYCKSWSTTAYDSLKSKTMEKPLYINWYLAAHFLSPVQLNHFRGTLKSYLAYMDDIQSRAKITKTELLIDDKRSCQCKGLLDVMEIVSMYSGRTSGKYSDYFPEQSPRTSEDVYTGFLDKFVVFREDGIQADAAYEDLRNFCNEPVEGLFEEDGQAVKTGLYFDAENPIPNRNLIYADMYGNEGLIADCISGMEGPVTIEDGRDRKGNKKAVTFPVGKITREEIAQYHRLRRKLDPVFHRGYCCSREELEEQRAYIRLKNRVELVDIAVYTDIMNDLFNRLVVWCNLWERDQMYLKLGYQYVKLFFTDAVPADDNRRKISVVNGPDFKDGAILYQIEAMYNYDLPVFICDDLQAQPTRARIPAGGRTQTSSENAFKTRYSTADAFDAFYGGMAFFDDNESHCAVVKNRRNYIDHLNYYSSQRSNNNHSIMELYAFMYNDTFRYDTKLRKSTTYVFENILARYRVLTSLSLELGKMVDGTGSILPIGEEGGNADGSTPPVSEGRSVAIFRSSRRGTGLRSDVYTFKIKGPVSEKEQVHKRKNGSGTDHGKQADKGSSKSTKEVKYKVASRSHTFLAQLDALLTYRQRERV